MSNDAHFGSDNAAWAANGALRYVWFTPRVHADQEVKKMIAKPKPPPESETDHFGIDGLSLPFVGVMVPLNDRASGQNGPDWAMAEPYAPVNGVHTYASAQPFIDRANGLHALGRKYQVNLDLGPSWAMNTGVGTHIDPLTGKPTANFLRIKPQHLADWGAVITYLLSQAKIDFLQIGSESENHWEQSQAGAAGFAEAVRVARDAARKVNPDIKIMACGINFGNRFLLGPPEPLSTKQQWVRWFLAAVKGNLDILSMHLTHLPTGFPLTVAWVRDEMKANGYELPIWADDMASGPFFDEELSTQTELDLQEDVEADGVCQHGGIHTNVLATYATYQARYVIIKTVTAFGSGVSRCFVSSDQDATSNFIHLWWYQGLIRQSDSVRRPAYYAYLQEIELLDRFSSVEKINDSAYLFKGGAKSPCVVAWNPTGSSTINLAGVLGRKSVTVRTPVTTLNGSNQPIYPADTTQPAHAVPIDITPVFVF